MYIKKGDQVQIINGKDKGKKGKIIKVFVESEKVVVDGLNLRKKHLRARRQGEKGQRVEVPGAMHVSNVMIVDPRTGQVTRVGHKTLADGKKIRISKKTGEEI